MGTFNVWRPASITLLIASAFLSQYASAVEDVSRQIKLLEKELKELKRSTKNNKNTNNRLKKSLKDSQDRLSISGFLSAGLSQSNRDRDYYGVSNDLTTLARGKMGLQVSFKVSDKAKAVLQIQGIADTDDWNLGAQWAYLSYDLSTDYTFRAGRLRAPMFSQSEVLSVGYSYPWVRTPLDAYASLPFSNFDGFDVTYRFVFGDAPGRVKAYYGNNAVRFEKDDIDLRINDFIGFDYTQTWTSWNLRIGYAKAHPHVIIPILQVDGEFSGNFGGVGINYDDGNWLFMTEFTRREVDSYAVSNVDGYYLTLGYAFGNWLPFVSYGRSHSTDDQERADLVASTTGFNQVVAGYTEVFFNHQQRTASIGVRYDISSGIALKGEIGYVDDLGDTNGLFGSGSGIPTLAGYKNGTIVNFVMDAVF